MLAGSSSVKTKMALGTGRCVGTGRDLSVNLCGQPRALLLREHFWVCAGAALAAPVRTNTNLSNGNQYRHSELLSKTPNELFRGSYLVGHWPNCARLTVLVSLEKQAKTAVR